jgi:hypothetical protein
VEAEADQAADCQDQGDKQDDSDEVGDAAADQYRGPGHGK